jgi:hypothetical protein
VQTLRIQDQDKQAAHSRPPISISLFGERPFSYTKKITKGPQISYGYLKQTRLR